MRPFKNTTRRRNRSRQFSTLAPLDSFRSHTSQPRPAQRRHPRLNLISASPPPAPRQRNRDAVKRLGASLLLIALCARAFGAEVIPPPPEKYFNDYAHVVSPDTASRLNK